MKRDAFEQLVRSVRQAGRICRGAKASRAFSFAPADLKAIRSKLGKSQPMQVNDQRGLCAILLLSCLPFHGCAREGSAPGLTRSKFDAVAEGSTADEARKQLGAPFFEAVQVTMGDEGQSKRIHWFYGKHSSWGETRYSVPVLTFVDGKLASRAWDSAGFDELAKSTIDDEPAQ